MKFFDKLPAALIGTAVSFMIMQPQISVALTVDEINNIAQQITVRIDGANTGSGVIIAREGNTYYVLTAEHVVRDEGKYQIVTSNGSPYELNYSVVRKLPGADLAVLQFTSNQNYQVARFSDFSDVFPSYGGRNMYWDASQSRFQTMPNSYSAVEVFVFGWPDLGVNRQGRSRVFSPGRLVPKHVRNYQAQASLADGYEVTYSSITYPGMSGGPVLDSSGRVIAIHGRAEGEEIYTDPSSEDDRLKLGFSLGIPISSFVKLAPRTGIKLALKVESSLPTKLTGDTSFNSLLPQVTQSTGAIDWANRGNQLRRIGRTQESIAAYDKAVEINPKFYQAWYARGRILLMDLQRYQEALASLDRAIQIQPNFYLAWYVRSQVLSQQGYHQEALASLDRAIQIKPDYYILWFERASVLKMLKRPQEEIAAYSKAIELKPSAIIYASRGTARLVTLLQKIFHSNPVGDIKLSEEILDSSNIKDYQAAVEDFNEALRLDPNTAVAYQGICSTRAIIGDYHGAIENCSQALRYDPSLPDAYNMRGASRFILGDHQRAMEDFNQALQLQPNLARAYSNRATARRALRDYQGAIEDLQKAATLFREEGDIVIYQRVLDMIGELRQ